jgi:hypothetical protein
MGQLSSEARELFFPLIDLLFRETHQTWLQGSGSTSN